jgi:hypothetical protein
VRLGTLSELASNIAAYCAAFSAAGILAELNCGGGVPREGVLRSLQLLCEEVMPACR